MNLRSLLVTLPVATLLACSGGGEPETPPEPTVEPAPVESMDPVVVGPTVYTSVFENDSVRISKVSFDPGEAIAMHTHPDHAIYGLTGGKLEITSPDGKVSVMEITPGMAAFAPGESHSAKNIGDTVVDAALVEIKMPATASAPAGTDPMVAGPSIYKMVFENERARIFETTFAAGAEIPMHVHPDHAVWALTAGKIAITGADGKTEEIALEPGQATFMPATQHSAKNIGETELKLVVFELKPTTPAVATP